MHLDTNMGEQSPLFTCKAHIFQVDPDTRKTWLPLSNGAVNVQIFHDSVKNVYRIVSIDGSKVLINTIITARMSFTKTSQKFCQWVDSRANHVYGLGFANEPELTRFMDKFIEVKDATRHALKQGEARSSSVDARQTPRSEGDWSVQSTGLDSSAQNQLKQENAHLKIALAQSSNNAKKWQEELEILRNNNAKLTTALQESHANVEEWKRQLQFYRDECTRLRQMVSTHHPSSDGQNNETQELKCLLDNADQRNQEQEQKIMQLENQIQRYTTQINTLEDRLASAEEDNQGLRNEVTKIQRRSPQNVQIGGGGTLPRSSNRNAQQLVRLRDLFESKTNDFNQTLLAKSQDLQRICSQITQTITEF
ncbi:unnamed protein product [Rotaria socialis]|uniref:WH1 domain-containing protein n=1 Tax=Rotaria socialis TaxID=392032 RepID=A0A817VYT8_9BILA|nr:unnamed protein product [Rotaria socialis]CAF3449551.1 unnamed protein product [Rotaria socialis]CAF3461110.1 unnamed protein product [Rotaria socialis]CAF3778696.1 unnamed protein product [Rotaria socialis]CAF4172056.1 unnamed protein product [Rotaria socialis]